MDDQLSALRAGPVMTLDGVRMLVPAGNGPGTRLRALSRHHHYASVPYPALGDYVLGEVLDLAGLAL
jgi:hypothetical protein